jgi:hypothetical protein
MWRALVSLGVIAGGCGPYLKTDEVRREAWAVSARCAQGPFEVAAKTLGARWGESLQVSVAAPRRVAGRYELWLAGKRIADGPWQANLRPEPLPGSQVAPPPPPFKLDNERCLPRPVIAAPTEPEPIVLEPPPPAVVALVVPPPPFAPPPLPPPPVPMGPPPDFAPILEPPLPARPPVPEPPRAVVALAAAPEPPRAPPHLIASKVNQDVAGSRAWTQIASWSVEQRDPAGPAPIAAGSPVRVVIWSETPNDLDGARFVLIQTAMRPNVTDAEWIAHLEAERAEANRRAQEWQQEQQARAAHCRAHLDDADCWGDGGYPAHQQRQRDLEARWRAQAAAAKPPKTATPPPIAQGPPPPAKPEDPGPKPSADAEWLPGSWSWRDANWAWTSGRWQLPRQPQVLDRARDRCTNVPRPEFRAQPVPCPTSACPCAHPELGAPSKRAAATGLVLRSGIESLLGRGARARCAEGGCAQTHTLTVTLTLPQPPPQPYPPTP